MLVDCVRRHLPAHGPVEWLAHRNADQFLRNRPAGRLAGQDALAAKPSRLYYLPNLDYWPMIPASVYYTGAPTPPG